MKKLGVAGAVFALAFAASALLDIDWVQREWMRCAVVGLLMLGILTGGFFVLREMSDDKGEG